VAQQNFSSTWLGMTGGGLERRWWTAWARAVAQFLRTKRSPMLHIRRALVQDVRHQVLRRNLSLIKASWLEFIFEYDFQKGMNPIGFLDPFRLGVLGGKPG
jgi:hypothetical protein